MRTMQMQTADAIAQIAPTHSGDGRIAETTHPPRSACGARYASYQLYDAPAPHVVAAELRPAPTFTFRFSRMRTDAPIAPAW